MSNMKNITILDLDYYHGKAEGPNPQAMKLSSYLKQKGYVINFVENEIHLKMKFDKAYVFRERNDVLNPPSSYLLHEETVLIGDSFKYFTKHGELPSVVAVIRPDYQLYNFDKMTTMTNANFIQFFHDGRLMKKRQDYHNTKPGVNKLVIMDEDFWSYKEEDVLWVLEFLTKERHIHFKYPIKLSKILASKAAQELFKKLHISPGTQLVFKNDLGHGLPQLREAIDFIGEIDTKLRMVANSRLSIASITANHYKNPDKISEDFMRLLEIIDYAKEKGVRLTVKAPKSREYTPFYDQFEFFDGWTHNYPYTSFVVGMLTPQVKKQKVKWYEILNNQSRWKTNRIKNVVAYLLNEKEVMSKYGFRKNSTEFDDINLIDFKELEKFRIRSSVEVKADVKD